MPSAPSNEYIERNISPDWVFRDLPNNSDDIDDAIAASSVQLFDVPTTYMGTASGFLSFGGAELIFSHSPSTCSSPCDPLGPGGGGTRTSPMRTDESTSGDGDDGSGTELEAWNLKAHWRLTLVCQIPSPELIVTDCGIASPAGVGQRATYR
jgi:hypothetical protein